MRRGRTLTRFLLALHNHGSVSLLSMCLRGAEVGQPGRSEAAQMLSVQREGGECEKPDTDFTGKREREGK